MFPGHLVRGFVFISSRHDPPALLIPSPLPTQLDFIKFHHDLPDSHAYQGLFEVPL
jgi:hypothetical protein